MTDNYYIMTISIKTKRGRTENPQFPWFTRQSQYTTLEQTTNNNRAYAFLVSLCLTRLRIQFVSIMEIGKSSIVDSKGKTEAPGGVVLELPFPVPPDGSDALSEEENYLDP